MKKKILLLILIFLIFFTSTLCSIDKFNVSEDYEIKSAFIGDIDYYNPQYIGKSYKKLGINTLTIPIAWSKVEKEEGKYDFTIYTNFLDAYKKMGFNFIFILDAGGRWIISDKDEIVSRSIPDWVWEKYPESHSVDFEGNKLMNFDFAEERHLDSVEKFYQASIDALGEYKQNIVAFSPGIMPELEIKLGQEGYRWQTYSKKSKLKYQEYLLKTYKDINSLNRAWGTEYNDFSQIEMPIINYNNNLTDSFPRDKVGFKDFIEYREKLVKDYITPLTNIIHQKGYNTIGYFSQTFSSHDAIYASGIVAKVVDLIDIAVMDFNFYDGYGTHNDSTINSFLVNYAKQLGYKKVIAGIYVERLEHNEDSSKLVNETLKNIYDDGYADGIELGGINPLEVSKWKEINKIKKQKPLEKENKIKIGIYASHWNYYKWHGERSFGWNYLVKSLTETYKILSLSKGYKVDVIGDNLVTSEKIGEYDVIVIPSQIVVSQKVKDSIGEYIRNGGNVIQDWRFGEFLPDGTWSKDWCNEAFGIEGIGWSYQSEKYKYKDQMMDIPYFKGKHIFSVANFANNLEFSLNMVNVKDSKNKTLLTSSNTVVIGFQPQVLAILTKDKKWEDFLEEVILELVVK